MRAIFYRVLFLLMAMILVSSCNTDQQLAEIEKAIEEIGLQWVPDKREGVSTVSVSLEGGVYTLKGELDQPGHRDALLAWFSDNSFTVTDSIRMLPDNTAGDWALVKVAAGTMRAQPRHAAELLTQATLGTPLKIMKREGSWLWVQTPDRYLGWITASSVEITGAEGLNEWRSSERVIVITNSTFVYGDEKETTIVSDIVLGSILVTNGRSSRHYQVIFPDGRTGFLRRSESKSFSLWLAEATPTVPSLTMNGQRLMGVSYLWGGTTAYALDCSGFMKTIFFINGVILARDASLQQRHGEEVESSATDYAKLQPGDIVFFGNQRTRRAGHVGLYLGDGEVMHESGMVRVDNLSKSRANFSNYLFTTYLSARRVLGLPSQPGLVAVREHPWYVNF